MLKSLKMLTQGQSDLDPFVNVSKQYFKMHIFVGALMGCFHFLLQAVTDSSFCCFFREGKK